MTLSRLRLPAVALGMTLLASSGVAFAHAERDAFFPDGKGKVPKYRPMVAKPNLVVCTPKSRARIMKIDDAKLRSINLALLRRCDFRNLQDAVYGVRKKGTTIYMLPGVSR